MLHFCLDVSHLLLCDSRIADDRTGWDTGTFFSYYTMVFVCPILYVGWKVVKTTKVIKPEEADLVSDRASTILDCLSLLGQWIANPEQAWERPVIDAYEAKCG